jgi:hypothetical protein
MNDKKFYTVPFVWNKTLWAMTFACFALWIGLSGWFIFQICTTDNDSAMLGSLIVLNVVFLPTIIACEGLAPQRLEIGEERIVILRRYKSVVINRSEIKSVQALSKSDFSGAVRTFGVGGLFGFFGHYHSNKLGSFRLYATSFENLFLVKLWNGKSIVFSCSEPNKMHSYLN